MANPETPETVNVEGVAVVFDPSTGRVGGVQDVLAGVQSTPDVTADEPPEWLVEVLHVLTGLANGEQDADTLTPGHALAALANVPADVLDIADVRPIRPTRWSGASFSVDGVGGVSVDQDALANALAALPDVSVDVKGTFTDGFWTSTGALPTHMEGEGCLLVEHGVVTDTGVEVRPGADWVGHVQAARRTRVVRRRVLVVEDWQDVPRD